MPNKNYIAGVRKERKLVNEARAKGLVSSRNAGSHGCWDVTIIDPKLRVIQLLQCKPRSMSQNAQEALQSKFAHLNGDYHVEFRVVS